MKRSSVISYTLFRVTQEKQLKMGALIQKTLDEGSVEAPTLDDARLDHLSYPHRQHVQGMLSSLSSMWDGTLGEINMFKHRINLIPGPKPVYSHPCRAGP